MQPLIDLAERGWIPDSLIRFGIRRLCRERLNQETPADERDRRAAFERFVETIKDSPVAVATDAANEQHYEVPAEFFRLLLGPNLKYSSCYWPDGVDDLEAAERAMLELTCERAKLAGARRILELGCGWGSLTLWMAEHYPNAEITAISNSHGQRRFIEARAAERGLTNVQVVTADMREFDTNGRFDRIISIEMFEHMRNYEELLRRIASWLDDDGMLFVHIFCHRNLAYFYEPTGPNDWMAREFFTGGTMPSHDLLLEFRDHVELDERWIVNGLHYQRTLESWLERVDARREAALALFEPQFGRDGARRQLQRWRIFVMACSELFGYAAGEEWWVSHYRFKKRLLKAQVVDFTTAKASRVRLRASG